MNAPFTAPRVTTLKTVVHQTRRTVSFFGLVAAALVMIAVVGGHAAKSAITRHAITTLDRGAPNTNAVPGPAAETGIPQPPR